MTAVLTVSSTDEIDFDENVFRKRFLKMAYKLKLRLLAYFLLMLSYLTVSTAVPFNSYLHKEKSEVMDMTKDLSDAELEMALSDLSLSDLEKLSKLIDESNEEYEYENDGYQKGNERMQPFYGLKFNDDQHLNEEDQDIDEELNNEMRNFQNSMTELRRGPRSDTQRSKREDVLPQKITVNEDYIKQLENSFPRDQGQNDQEFNDQKKEHVRVKRE